MSKVVLLSVLVLLSSTVSAFAGEDESLQLGASFFYDYFIDLNDYEEGNQTPSTGFELRRSYLTMKKSWGDVMFRYTADVDTKYGTGNLNIFTKYAYLEHSGLMPNAKVLVGQHSPKTHGWVDKLWAYRSMAKSLSDANKWTHAAVLGMGVQGKAADGKLEYYLDLNNGNGYKAPLRKDGLGLAARAVLQPRKGLILSGLFTSNTEGTYEDETIIAGSDEADVYYEGLAGFENKRFGIFGQYGLFTDGPSELESAGVSLFGRALFAEGTYAVARFDTVDPDTNTDNDGYNWLLVGVSHELHKGLHIQPSFRFKTFELEDTDSQKEIVITFYGKI